MQRGLKGNAASSLVVISNGSNGLAGPKQIARPKFWTGVADVIRSERTAIICRRVQPKNR